jgi:transcriptional regulator with XRE-family HTH domain
LTYLNLDGYKKYAMDSSYYDNNRLKELRRIHGLTQQEVADILGIRRQTIWRAERGLSISFNLLNALARVYGIKTLKLMRDSRSVAA